jgi:outer membrane lipoprotein LolB
MYVSVSSRTSTKIRHAALAAFVVLVTGCATEKGLELPDISDWDRRSAVLSQIDQFDFNGRIAVKAGDDGFNGKLRWYQESADFRATVSGPLGIGTVRIAGDGDIVRVTDKDGVTTVLADVEADLYVRYGWTIPVESLRYWALGIPDPRIPAETTFGDAGELAALTQRGWTVTISRYREAGGGQPMPRLLNASNAETNVRLVIDRWVFRETVGTW